MVRKSPFLFNYRQRANGVALAEGEAGAGETQVDAKGEPAPPEPVHFPPYGIRRKFLYSGVAIRRRRTNRSASGFRR